MPKVLIAGASGVVGSAAVDRFLETGWEVVAVSRRAPEVTGERGFEHVPVDLQDTAAARAVLGRLDGVTHVVYAALYEKPGLMAGWTERDQMETNLAMLRNVMEPLAGVRHVSLLQGTKAYGAHLHPIPVPARERAPRDAHENFYWLQEDYLRAAAAQRDFAWTILRPQVIFGGPVGVAMNVVPVIGVYAAICRAERLPFGFPGGSPWVWQGVDSRIVAGALLWAASTPAAAGEIFNVTNGEVSDWRHLWPAIAEALGAEPGPDRPCQLSSFLPEQEAVWQRVVAEHDLRRIPLADLLGESHHYADFLFLFGVGAEDAPPPALVSTVKLRQAGFCEAMETEQTLRYWLAKLIERRILPPP